MCLKRNCGGQGPRLRRCYYVACNSSLTDSPVKSEASAYTHVWARERERTFQKEKGLCTGGEMRETGALLFISAPTTRGHSFPFNPNKTLFQTQVIGSRQISRTTSSFFALAPKDPPLLSSPLLSSAAMALNIK